MSFRETFGAVVKTWSANSLTLPLGTGVIRILKERLQSRWSRLSSQGLNSEESSSFNLATPSQIPAKDLNVWWPVNPGYVYFGDLGEVATTDLSPYTITFPIQQLLNLPHVVCGVDMRTQSARRRQSAGTTASAGDARGAPTRLRYTLPRGAVVQDLPLAPEGVTDRIFRTVLKTASSWALYSGAPGACSRAEKSALDALLVPVPAYPCAEVVASSRARTLRRTAADVAQADALRRVCAVQSRAHSRASWSGGSPCGVRCGHAQSAGTSVQLRRVGVSAFEGSVIMCPGRTSPRPECGDQGQRPASEGDGAVSSRSLATQISFTNVVGIRGNVSLRSWAGDSRPGSSDMLPYIVGAVAEPRLPSCGNSEGKASPVEPAALKTSRGCGHCHEGGVRTSPA
ncbi:hypothetical protein B0H13DRAFT_1850314 [Mycena leptocephala]|nr:hypothetical protein B0H13DRAFT_1850314 [Mycena leptocephala]